MKNIQACEDVNKIFEIFYNKNPNPTTELKYLNNYTLLVAIILSARATDKIVNRATEKLFAIVAEPKDMLSLGIVKLGSFINIIGLWNSKGKNIIKMTEILIDKFNGNVPDNFEDLIILPGVGRKTANVFLNCAFNLPTMPVDTHVSRVSLRIGLAEGNNLQNIEKQLLNIIPDKWLGKAHHWLILHGRYICKSRKPNCGICSIKNLCNYYNSLNNK